VHPVHPCEFPSAASRSFGFRVFALSRFRAEKGFRVFGRWRAAAGTLPERQTPAGKKGAMPIAICWALRMSDDE
jgi:hypothetical protein